MSVDTLAYFLRRPNSSMIELSIPVLSNWRLGMAVESSDLSPDLITMIVDAERTRLIRDGLSTAKGA